MVTLTLAGLMIVMTHYYGVKAQGMGGYLKQYITPMWWLAPIKIIEEFTYNLTLGLRLTVTFMPEKFYLTLVTTRNNWWNSRCRRRFCTDDGMARIQSFHRCDSSIYFRNVINGLSIS